MWLWQQLGKFLYYVAGPFAFRIFLNGSQRTRVLVVSGDSIVLGKTWISAQKWNVLGGGIKKGESIEVAACRELLEETGIEVSPEQLIALGAERYKGYQHITLLHYFVVTLPETVELHRAALELTDLAWFNIDTMTAKQYLHANVETALARYNQNVH